MNLTRNSAHAHRRLERRRAGLLREARRLLTGRALKLIGFVLFAYLILQLIPGLESALTSLKGVRWQWLVGAAAIETLSGARGGLLYPRTRAYKRCAAVINCSRVGAPGVPVR
jgi:hypothetical protein